MRQFLLFLTLLLGMMSTGFWLLFRNLGEGIIQEPLERQAHLRIDELQKRVLKLEEQPPRTRGELAVIVGVRESYVDYLLDRSELLPDAQQLCEAIRISGAQSVWKALQVESNLYRSFTEFKAKHPMGDATWHYVVWAPFLERSIAAVCDQLYQLNLPSSMVESFRLKLREGI